MISATAENKAFHPHISEKIQPFWVDELRIIWQQSNRDWSGVYSKKNLEVSF